jgi:hypothetical protein
MSSASTTVTIQQAFMAELATIKERYEMAKVKEITGDSVKDVIRFEAFQSRLNFFERCVRSHAEYNQTDPTWKALLRLKKDFFNAAGEFILTL